MDVPAMWTLLFVFIAINNYAKTTAATLDLPCVSPLTICGKPAIEPSSMRVIRGEEAQIGAWPWTVMLVENGYHACGGSIINEKFILTATHCFLDGSDNPAAWQVIAGKHHIDRVDPGQQVVKVSKIITHEHYNNVTVANDIALLLLENPLIYSTLVQPICLPTADQGVTTGEPCMLAGWGETRGTSDPNVLNQVLLPIIADDTCARPDYYWTDFIPATTFCAGYEEGLKDACTGDSGGPLICKHNDTWYAQGIASWGYGCAEYKWPGIYTDVSKYTDWILEKVLVNSLFCGLIG